MAAVPVRGHKGGARPTTLSGALSNSALSFTVTAGGGTGFPDGSNGAFVVTLDAGLAGEEKVLCSSRSTDTFTVPVGGRGYDNTVASSHANLASVAHTYAAIEAQEANDHIVDVTRDDHTQYAFVKKSLAALRGAAGRSMKFHYGTDSGLLGLDDGTSWHDFQDKASAEAAYRPLASRGVRVYKTAATANILNASFATITWDAESHDSDAFHDNATNASRLTIPAGMGGLYLVSVALRYAGSAAGTTRGCVVAVNGATRVQVNMPPTATDHTVSVTDALRLVAGDYVEIQAYQDSGGGLSLVGGSAAYSSASMSYLGA